MFVVFVIWIVRIYIFFLHIMSNINEKDILDRINDININDLESIQFYKSDSELDYKDFLNIWKNFIENRFFEDNTSNNISNENIASVIKISYKEDVLGILLEDLFKKQLDDIYDNMIIIYLKNNSNNDVLVFYKSFFPLLNDKKIKLPFWNYVLKSENFTNKLNKIFKKKENICLLSYIIK